MPLRASQIAVLAGGALVNMDGSEGWMRVSCGLGGASLDRWMRAAVLSAPRLQLGREKLRNCPAGD
jgi:hypothetical protein